MVGKSFVGLLASIKMQKLYTRKTKTIIIVPDSNLFRQWNGIIKSLKLEEIEVYVINTVALGDKIYDCDLLIIDEVHKTPGHSFRKVFTKVKYKFNLNLTATLNRLDGLESFIKGKAPVCFERDVSESIKRGWIADVATLNVPVFLTSKEEEGLKSITNQVNYYIKKFGDFKVMQSCMNSANARTYAMQFYKNDDPQEKAKEIVKWAIQGDRAVRMRKEFLYNCEQKIDATIDLLNEFKVKSITFSQSIKFAEAINEIMGSESTIYHSSLESEYRKFKKSKAFKTEKGANNFAVKNGYKDIKEKDGEYIVSWYSKKKISGKAVATDNVNKYLSDKVRNISAAKGLDVGFDCDTILIGIDAARTSSEIDLKQKRG